MGTERGSETRETLHEPEDARLDSEDLTCLRFMGTERGSETKETLHEPEDARLDSEDLTCLRFMGTERGSETRKTLHEPEDARLDSEDLTCLRFMGTERGSETRETTHEPACSAGFPACGFTGLSSPVDQERATGKSPGPAGSKACATNPPRFMVPMRGIKVVEASREPERRAPARRGES